VVGQGGVFARFCIDGAWRARGNFPVFSRSRDSANRGAVVFPGIGIAYFFDDAKSLYGQTTSPDEPV